LLASFAAFNPAGKNILDPEMPAFGRNLPLGLLPGEDKKSQ